MRYVFSLILILAIHPPSYAQTDNLASDWHLNSNGWPITVSIARQGDKYLAFVADADSACNKKLDSVTWDAETGSLEFRMAAPGVTQWYRVTVADGLMIGRFSNENATKAGKPTDPLSYKYHVTGWSQDYFQSITRVVFDVYANGFRGRLRIDKSGEQFVGRLKMYAYENQVLECLEEEITVSQWDGEKLAFTRGTQVYTGAVDGRHISGSYMRADGTTSLWSGRRAEVLTYGLTAKSAEARLAWQERTRRILYRLMMAGNPAPASVNVEILADDLPPISSEPYSLRDDDPAQHPQNYRLTELRLTYTIPGPFGVSTRVVHAYLAKPTTPPPNGLERYPLVVAVNGHMGSAYNVMDGGTLFWYGDAWARRGYMVLAVDIGHRPDADVVRARSIDDLSTYLGYPDISYPGDDPAHGNGLRSSIKPAKPAGFTSADWAYYTDWEVDGERVWDVMQALDWVLTRPDVDPNKIIVTGLSMGGEVASYVGALDPRVAVTIPASGPAPDLSVFKYLRRVGHCVHWSFADIREFIDHSDILALIAPRPLIVQTGQQDRTYSEFSSPFAGDKQALMRARAAYGDGPLLHFLHPLGHEYRAGAVAYTVNDGQTDASTATDGRTLFDYVRQFLNF
jgi:dienelactone hydrolase